MSDIRGKGFLHSWIRKPARFIALWCRRLHIDTAAPTRDHKLEEQYYESNRISFDNAYAYFKEPCHGGGGGGGVESRKIKLRQNTSRRSKSTVQYPHN